MNTRLKLWLTGRQIAAASPKARLAAVRTLREVSDDSVFSLLVRALSDEDREVRREAALALGDESDDRAVAALIGALNDRIEAVQEAAIHSLRRLNDPQCVDALVNACHRAKPSVQWHAAQALKLFRWKPTNADEEIQWLVALGEFDRVASFGAPAVPAISNAFEHGALETRLAAINALDRIGADAAQKIFLAALNDEEASVRLAAAHALARHPAAAVIRALIVLLKDGDNNVRVAAANSLGKLRDAQAVMPLKLLLKDHRWEIRAASLEALGRIGDSAACEAVAPLLADKDAEVRRHALEACGALGDESLFEKLVVFLTDENPALRDAAMRALNRIAPGWMQSERVQQLMPEMQAALKDMGAGAQFAAMNLIRAIGGNKAAPAQAFTQANVEAVRAMPNAASAALRQLLRDADALVRLAAAESVAQLKLAACADTLQLALADPDPFVKAAAARALAALDKPVAPAVDSPAQPPPVLEEIFICSTQGEMLHRWQCDAVDDRLTLLQFLSQRAQRLAASVPLGEFNRVELDAAASRRVVIITADYCALVRVAKAAAPAEQGKAAKPASVEPGELKERLAAWVRQAPFVRGALVRSVRLPDQTIFCDVDSQSFPLVALEQVFRSAAEVFQTLAARGEPAVRLSWLYSKTALHFTRRPDGALLGVFTLPKPVEVERLLAEFRAVV